MPDYPRNRIPGETCFFTVNLLMRRSRLLVEAYSSFHRLVASGIYPGDWERADGMALRAGNEASKSRSAEGAALFRPTELTHNINVYDSLGPTLITSKKKKDMQWAQPIFVL